MEKRKSTVLFLCAGIWQYPWLSYLKDKGHSILLVDPNNQPYCKQFADDYIQCDVLDTEAIIKEVEKRDVKIEMVTSEQTDVSTIPIAILSDYFQTRHIPLEVVQKFTNKYTSKVHASNLDPSHVPAFTLVNNPEELTQFLKGRNGNVIIKPVNAQSSRGIAVIQSNESQEEMLDKFQTAVSFSSLRQAIVEEFVYGTEITVEGFVLNRRHQVLAISRKKHFRTGIASELAYPLITHPTLRNQLEEFHNRLVETTGIPFGITHTEYIIDEETGRFWLVEMACRGGGSLIPSHITPWVSGVNVYDWIYKALFTDEKMPEKFDVQSKSAILFFFEFDAGKVKAIHGVDACRGMEGVLRLNLEFEVGSVIKPASDDRGRQGYCIVCTDSLEQSYILFSQIHSQIKVEYEL